MPHVIAESMNSQYDKNIPFLGRNTVLLEESENTECKWTLQDYIFIPYLCIKVTPVEMNLSKCLHSQRVIK
jgi:hypothetical protein